MMGIRWGHGKGQFPKERDWHIKLMQSAKFYGSWSKCLSRSIGAVIVRDNTIIATGYNGPPRGVPHCSGYERRAEIVAILEGSGDFVIDSDMKRKLMDETHICPRKLIGKKSGDLLSLCIAGHAEKNALLNAARMGQQVGGADLFTYSPMPCFECTKGIINAGIARVFCLEGVYDKYAWWLFEHSGVKVYHMPQSVIDQK